MGITPAAKYCVERKAGLKIVLLCGVGVNASAWISVEV